MAKKTPPPHAYFFGMAMGSAALFVLNECLNDNPTAERLNEQRLGKVKRDVVNYTSSLWKQVQGASKHIPNVEPLLPVHQTESNLSNRRFV